MPVRDGVGPRERARTHFATHWLVRFLLTVVLAAGCTASRSGEGTSPEGTAESMPGWASIWLASESPGASLPIDVVVTSPGEPDIRLAVTFAAGQLVRGDFATGEGRFVVSALNGACSTGVDLKPDQEAQLQLVVVADRGCSLSIVWQGYLSDPARPRHGDGVLVRNGAVGDATPQLELPPASMSPAPSASSVLPSLAGAGLGASNATTVEVALAVNGVIVERLAPGQRIDAVGAALPPMPWRVEARSPSGRVLAMLEVQSGSVGRLASADLSCGRVTLWYGAPPAGEPSLLPGQSGDCR